MRYRFKSFGEAQINIRENGLVSMRIAEVGPAQVCHAEVRLNQVRPTEVRSAKIRLGEVRASKVRPAEVRPTKVRSTKVCPLEVCSLEVRLTEVRVTERCFAETCLAEIRPGKVRPAEECLAEIHPGEVRPAQVWRVSRMLIDPAIPVSYALLKNCNVFRIGHGGIVYRARAERRRLSGTEFPAKSVPACSAATQPLAECVLHPERAHVLLSAQEMESFVEYLHELDDATRTGSYRDWKFLDERHNFGLAAAWKRDRCFDEIERRVKRRAEAKP